MVRVKFHIVLFLLLAAFGSHLAGAQGTDVFARARTLVNNGDARAGRALVDSVLAAATPGTPAYAEALYWHAVLAEDGDAARTDLLRVAIEFPLSPFASEALLRLAQLEMTRGDHVTALRHLDRLEREYPTSPSRAAGRYWAGRILLEDTKPADACVALHDARRLTAASNIELLNQIDYYARPCDAIEADAKARADSITADSIARANAPAAAKKTADPTATRASTGGRWSVQVAAYSDRQAALALAKRLSIRGHDARVTTTKPWRVRVGFFTTRAKAAEVAKELSTTKSKAIVVEAERR